MKVAPAISRTGVNSQTFAGHVPGKTMRPLQNTTSRSTAQSFAALGNAISIRFGIAAFAGALALWETQRRNYADTFEIYEEHQQMVNVFERGNLEATVEVLEDHIA